MLPAGELRRLAAAALEAAGTSRDNAAIVAAALIAAECDGIPSHGLSRLPFYADQVQSGKVNGRAVPEVSRPAASVVRADARDGFAFPALAAGAAALAEAAGETGLAALAVGHSHHCGVAGHHVEGLAERGLVALFFANTPGAIAPWGAARAVFGTNPIAFACPREEAPPLVVDLSMSVVARGKIMVAAQAGEAIPPEWALDAAGKPTSDAKAALQGTMQPIGGAKGAALALAVEILAAALTGSNFGFEASSFFEAKGPPPRVGHLVLALDPKAFDAGFAGRVESLLATIAQEPGVRLPGARRLAARAAAEARGIAVPAPLLAELRRRAQA